MSEWYSNVCEQLEELTNLIKGNLTSIQRKSLVSLIVSDVHCREIIDDLNRTEVCSSLDFKWQQSLKF